MVNNKIAQRAVAAGLSGLMAFGAAAPAALAYSIKDFEWVKVDSNDDGVFWKRLAGDDRYGTMKKIVEAYNEYEYKSLIGIYGKTSWRGYNYHSTAVVASGDNFPDALAANGLAGYLTNESLTVTDGSNGAVPVILTKSGSLSNEAKDLLKNMQVQNVIIMGGTAAVSQDVEDTIAKMGIGVSRVAGADRQETSLKAMQRIKGNWKGRKGTYDVIIATGDNYADALSIAPYAYRMGTPILLTKKDGTLTDAQVQAIKDNDEIKEILIVGGTDAVSDTVMGQIGTLKKNNVGVRYQRIAGADRYETSAKIAAFEVDAWNSYWTGYKGFSFDHAVVATGENFPDALAGGQLAGGVGIDVKDFGTWMPCPLLLTKDGDTRAEGMVSKYISVDDVTIGDKTYASFASWVNTVEGWYGNNTEEYKKLLADSAALAKRVGAWYDYSTRLYISLDAIEGMNGVNTGTGQNATVTGRDTFKFSITRTTDATGTAYYTVKDVTVTLDDGTIVFVDDDDVRQAYQTGQATFTYTDPVTGGSRTYTIQATDITGTTTTGVTKPGLPTALVPTLSYTAELAWQRDDASRPFTGWQTDIIGLVEADWDFYGIILGGTKAVSNDKRDDLDEAVAWTAGYDDVFTTGEKVPDTVTRLVDGVNVKFSRLVPVKDDVLNKDTYSINGTNYAKGTVEADVYSVAGTGSYVLYLRNAATGDFIAWKIFASGANNTQYNSIFG